VVYKYIDANHTYKVVNMDLGDFLRKSSELRVAGVLIWHNIDEIN
jgi:hypothetical protein